MKANRSKHLVIGAGALALLATQLGAVPAGTAFTYQGRLLVGPNAANGNYDLKFSLFDAASGGNLVGASQTNTAVGVSNGVFTIVLDFSAGPFDGSARWLEVGIRTNSGTAFTTTSPRQPLTSAPYAITASNLSGTLGAGLLAGTYGGVINLTNLANSFSGNGAGLTNLNASTLCGIECNGFWHLSGNGGASGDLNFLGMTDNQPLEFRVNNTRLLRLDPNGSMVGGFGSFSASFGTTISGGLGNMSFSHGVAIGGGSGNSEAGGSTMSTIGGGASNSISGSFLISSWSTIGGGWNNAIIEGALATIGGGYGNYVQRADSGSIGGGESNQIYGVSDSTIGGGFNNSIDVGSGGFGATIAGGVNNTISWLQNFAGTIGGGEANYVGSDFGTIAGGFTNRIGGNVPYCAILGGSGNQATGAHTTIGGGADNLASSDYASVLGGQLNMASGLDAVVGGGAANCAGGDYAYVGGGGHNTILPGAFNSAIAGGQSNTVQTNAYRSAISGGWSNNVTGCYAAIPGGLGNAATNFGLAAGHRAKAVHRGSLVWADSADADFASTASDQASFRLAGGVRFASGGGGANQIVTWTPGSASWSFTSDCNTKEDIQAVRDKEVLDRVSRLPISEWNYQGYHQRHIGPMAQDFHALFPLNESDTTLNSADLDGVALAAIKGLYEVVQGKDAEIRQLVREKDVELKNLVKAKDAEIEELKASIAELKALMSKR